MKRDLELIKKILLKIENEYINAPLYNIGIEGYDMQQIANHISSLYGDGLISKYNPVYGDGKVQMFSVGNLTNEGFNYLDSIRDTDKLESHKTINNVPNNVNITTKKFSNKGNIGNSNSQDKNKQINENGKRKTSWFKNLSIFKKGEK